MNACIAAGLNVALPALLGWVLAVQLHSRLEPESNFAAPQRGYGHVQMRLRLPGTAGGIPEPLVVCGVPGKATLVYIRLLSRARAKVGVEFWGIAAFESDVFALPAADAQIDVDCFIPALFPAEGSRRWGGVPPEIQALRRGQYRIRVGGVTRLEGRLSYGQPDRPTFYLGRNPLGGSIVSDFLTAKILAERQELAPAAGLR